MFFRGGRKVFNVGLKKDSNFQKSANQCSNYNLNAYTNLRKKTSNLAILNAELKLQDLVDFTNKTLSFPLTRSRNGNQKNPGKSSIRSIQSSVNDPKMVMTDNNNWQEHIETLFKCYD